MSECHVTLFILVVGLRIQRGDYKRCRVGKDSRRAGTTFLKCGGQALPWTVFVWVQRDQARAEASMLHASERKVLDGAEQVWEKGRLATYGVSNGAGAAESGSDVL